MVAVVDGINILYDIVEALEHALNPDYDKSDFKPLLKICGCAGTVGLMRPMPATSVPREPASVKKQN